ncbi:hypothetical protein B0H19DRAFT_1061615 [Mycena capillaripes]|nr:hypothetical protein B0H19DRAFT_1061615 [Mycena capillaripes]
METAAADGLERVEKLWFSPDVVVLRAQGRIFRVFVAILKEKSSVFADMFTFPQSSSDTETLDGSPIVTLHDDPAEVEVFLKAIFDSEFFMPPPAESKFEDTLGILRLAHKYDVPYLRRRALEHLEPTYPRSLPEYDGRKGIINDEPSDIGRRIATIETATEIGALWLLPVAYYDLCKYELSVIMKHPRWNALREKERKSCLIGHSAQIRQLQKISKFFSAVSNCEDSMMCNRLRLAVTFVGNTQMGRSMTWPLDYWNDERWAALGTLEICGTCITEAKAAYATARMECWTGLPEMFGLPAWPDLEEMRQAAFGMI